MLLYSEKVPNDRISGLHHRAGSTRNNLLVYAAANESGRVFGSRHSREVSLWKQKPFKDFFRKALATRRSANTLWNNVEPIVVAKMKELKSNEAPKDLKIIADFLDKYKTDLKESLTLT